MSFAYRKDVLDSGVRVVTESNDDAGSVALGVWMGVGSSCEPASFSGVSHFIEHILFKGTRRRTAYQIAYALESVGGSIDALTGRETTAFISRCLPEHVRRAVDVISDMLCRPAMSESAIEIEKSVIFEEIRNYEDTPEEVVHEFLARSIWNSNPMGKSVLGTMETVGRLTRDRILQYFKRFYVSGNTIVAASGRVNHADLVRYVDRLLKIPRQVPEPAEETYSGGLERVYHEARKVSQCYICLGTEAPPYVDSRRYATILLSLLVGGGMTSRLFQEVREKRGLAYSVYCSCEFYLRTGVFVIFLAVDPKKAKKAVAEVSRQLRLLKTDGLKKGELSSLKQQLKGSLVLGLESASARMSRLARQEHYLNGHRSMEESLTAALAVRRRDIMAEVGRLLDPSRVSLIAIGPRGTDFATASELDF
jgi:predicted Zn-dependent peptidase